ncbi:MAG: PAS domain S-box protein [Armatimonadota bacterium]|nr:PAS domain S-box protein [bacterium]
MIYAIVGGLWILLSDILLAALINEPATYTRIAILKGWFYVVATAILVYLLIRRALASLIHSEETLRDRDKQFQTRYNAIVTGMLVRNASGVVTQVNNAACDLMGLSLEQVLYQEKYPQTLEIVREDYTPLPAYEHPSVVALRTGQPVRNMMVGVRSSKDEDYRWLLINTVPVFDESTGKLLESVATFIDVTDLRQTQQAFIDSERRLASIIDFLPDATFAIDTKGRIIVWNRAAEEATGAKADDVLGKNDYEIGYRFYGKRRPMLADLVLHPNADIEKNYPIIERRDDTLIAETLVPMFGAKEAYIWAKATPLRDSEGNIVGAIESARDVTERKRAEEERHRQLEREQEIRQEAEEAKKEFYRGTIYSVTDGKLNLVMHDQINDHIVPGAQTVAINSSESMSELRYMVHEMAEEAGMSQERVESLLFAVGEAAANAVKHAGGGVATVGIRNSMVQVSIHDVGPGMDTFILPKATLLRGFSTKPSMGLGYSIILSSVDTVYLATGKEGTWVLMEKAVVEPEVEMKGALMLDRIPDSW